MKHGKALLLMLMDSGWAEAGVDLQRMLELQTETVSVGLHLSPYHHQNVAIQENKKTQKLSYILHVTAFKV